ncbi:DHS-like NAD/FAD-binding domain-containing protein [Hypoxylon sp. NC1633]|nr:DHS-like NAD/FAD-binding domain-containing protein [Hypoxylon sp. NC1633]
MYHTPRSLLLRPISASSHLMVTDSTGSFVSRRPIWTRHMAYAQTMAPRTSVDEFKELLNSSNRVLALCGAGLSAASGLPTFRGAGGLWRNHQATSLATPEAFEDEPALVWLFYAWRRHMALRAKPNRAHYALAELAKKSDDFLCLSQNVDGLSPRAGHPESKLRLLHGSLFDNKCFDECGYVDRDNLNDPVCPALAPAAEDYPPDKTLPLLDPNVAVPPIMIEDLPHCPNCKSGLLRPGVVWFGEGLDSLMLMEVDNWIMLGRVDIMLVIGTAAAVYPAAGYIRKAQRKGAIVVVVNPDPDSAEVLSQNDFFFQGDAAEILPRLFEGVIGKMDEHGQIS